MTSSARLLLLAALAALAALGAVWVASIAAQDTSAARRRRAAIDSAARKRVDAPVAVGATVGAQPPRRPDVRERFYKDAVLILRRSNLPTVRRDSIVTQGTNETVARQSPPAGTFVREGDVDTLIVRRVITAEVPMVPVPAVERETYANAVAIVRRAGLAPVGPALARADSVRARVAKQDPPPGRLVRTGTQVLLVPQINALVVVPPVISAESTAAKRILAGAGLSAGRFAFEANDLYAAGRVFHQDPAAGDSAKRGSSVALWVSTGPPPKPVRVAVPLVIGLTLDSARTTLVKRDLVLGHADTVKVENGDGRVQHQEPHANDTVHAGGVVRVTIAVPKPTALVPRLVGLSRARATDTLQRIGLSIGALSFRSDSAFADGAVVTQSPVEGVRLSLGEPVNVEVNAYRPAPHVRVPYLVGLNEQEAVRRILAVPLSRGSTTFQDGGRAGIVLSQKPDSGGLVSPGSFVSVVLGNVSTDTSVRDTTGKGTRTRLIVVPSVVDSSLAAAITLVNSAGFSAISVDTQSALQPAGRRATVWFVNSQQPGADEQEPPDTRIALSFAPGGIVPDLHDKRVIDAMATVLAEGFRMHVRDSVRSFRPFGERVIAQAPAANEQRRLGTQVEVTVVEPLSLFALVAGGVAAMVALGVLAHLTGLLGPRFQTVIHGEPPVLAAGESAPVVKAEVTLRTEAGIAPPGAFSARDDIILREKRQRD